MPFTKKNAKRFGKKGGKATVRKHGREHMQAIGRAGFLGLAKSLGFACGYRAAAVRKLQAMGRLTVPAHVRRGDLSPADLAAMFEELGINDTDD